MQRQLYLNFVIKSKLNHKGARQSHADFAQNDEISFDQGSGIVNTTFINSRGTDQILEHE